MFSFLQRSRGGSSSSSKQQPWTRGFNWYASRPPPPNVTHRGTGFSKQDTCKYTKKPPLLPPPPPPPAPLKHSAPSPSVSLTNFIHNLTRQYNRTAQENNQKNKKNVTVSSSSSFSPTANIWSPRQVPRFSKSVQAENRSPIVAPATKKLQPSYPPPPPLPPPSRRGIPNILLLNARSLSKQKISVVNRLLYTDWSWAHVLIVSETFFKKKTQNRELRGFTGFYQDRNLSKAQKEGGGGSAVYVSKSFCQNPKKIYEYAGKRHEAVAVTFTFGNKQCCVTGIYCAPDTNPGRRTQENDTIVQKVFEGLGKQTVNVFVGGDLNKSKITYANLTNYVHVPTRNNNVLDLLYTNVPKAFSIVTSKKLPLSSGINLDHNIVSLRN